MINDRIREIFKQGEGILHLTPTWVPRPFNEPGKRLRLHPDDYFALGMHRGSITERWFGSVTRADNGPDTGKYEAMSFVWDQDQSEKILFMEFVQLLGQELVGEELQDRYGGWPTYAKFFDNNKPLFHHLHLTEHDAARIGRHGKPEAYYFPVQYNNHMGSFPYTFFGFDPSASKEEIVEALHNYTVRDTRITELSRAFRIQLGTGWYVPAGIIHAPGSVLTYEPQWNSDVNTIFENVTAGEVNDLRLLIGCTPEHEQNDMEAIFKQLNWQESTRPDFRSKYFRKPIPLQAKQPGLTEKWIVYANEWIAAKEMTIAPGTEILLTDNACYGAIVVQGYGQFGRFNCEAPGLLRFDTISEDEFFVSEKAAKQGITVRNQSRVEPMVILQNFANNNPDVPGEI
ncbi:MAG: hypothetical protein FWG21_02045 [Oscillospiraceae bacterium]|nr:hypothetical protein [Oscillospiraceae bacterium]